MQVPYDTALKIQEKYKHLENTPYEPEKGGGGIIKEIVIVGKNAATKKSEIIRPQSVLSLFEEAFSVMADIKQQNTHGTMVTVGLEEILKHKGITPDFLS